MIRSFTIAASISLLTFCGCVEAPPEPEERTPAHEEKQPTLTAEAAKQALLHMEGDRYDTLGRPDAKDVPIQLAEKDGIAVGIFRCDLKNKTFHASASFPNRDRHQREEVSGVFEWRGGKWVAKATESSR
jgi:hypothetical protein